MTTTNPLAAILERPSRRSRSEFILRELLHTSYTHAFLGNLVMAFALQANYSQEQMTEVAQQFHEAEGKYGLLDFIRCVEIRRNGATVTVVVKTLKIDLDITEIDDDRKNHEYLASGTIELPDEQFSLGTPDSIGQLILQAFYDAQTRYRHNDPSFIQSTWISRTKTALSSGPKERGQAFTFNDTQITTEQALELLVQSLKRNKFHFILTTNTLLVQDQKKRLWGLNKTPRKLKA